AQPRAAVPAARRPASPPFPGRGTAIFAVLRRLLVSGGAIRQAELASTTGVTQPRVSQILSALTKGGLVKRRRDGWQVADWEDVLQRWLAQYPGPGGITTYWMGLDDPWSQALAALSALPAGSAVSGDLGADLLAPWRQPHRATLYAPALH